LVHHTKGNVDAESFREQGDKKRNEVRENQRKLQSIPTEVHGLHTSQNIIRVVERRRIKYAGQNAHMGERRGAEGVLVRKSERRSLRGRSECKREHNSVMDLK
jgi:hypothetical protein